MYYQRSENLFLDSDICGGLYIFLMNEIHLKYSLFLRNFSFENEAYRDILQLYTLSRIEIK